LDREVDIRSLTQPLIDQLYELHDEVDARKSLTSEAGKLEKAKRAIHIWWHVYGGLMLWAQSQIVGYEMMKASPKLRAELTEIGIDENSHVLELIGFGCAFDDPSLRPPIANLETTLSNEALRNVIARLLVSTDGFSSFWRVPLVQALRATNAGEKFPLFELGKTRRRGRPYVLDAVRSSAVAHVYYLSGKGIKKHIALERVAQALAVSVETLRGWEKSLSHDDWFSLGWRGAYLAGQLGDENTPSAPVGEEDEKTPSETVEEDDLKSIEPMSDRGLALWFLERINSAWTLERIKTRLRMFHSD
jgi:hypothetical protein